ncbi:MAG: hypothetical protein Q7R96_02115 [Nanoarchaeota archaeon]|nr:hypothetical protein [Nanoarchaeota archaeon]
MDRLEFQAQHAYQALARAVKTRTTEDRTYAEMVYGMHMGTITEALKQATGYTYLRSPPERPKDARLNKITAAYHIATGTLFALKHQDTPEKEPTDTKLRAAITNGNCVTIMDEAEKMGNAGKFPELIAIVQELLGEE